MIRSILSRYQQMRAILLTISTKIVKTKNNVVPLTCSASSLASPISPVSRFSFHFSAGQCPPLLSLHHSHANFKKCIRLLIWLIMPFISLIVAFEFHFQALWLIGQPISIHGQIIFFFKAYWQNFADASPSRHSLPTHTLNAYAVPRACCYNLLPYRVARR
jgi:hypothetical protein